MGAGALISFVASGSAKEHSTALSAASEGHTLKPVTKGSQVFWVLLGGKSTALAQLRRAETMINETGLEIKYIMFMLKSHMTKHKTKYHIALL